MRARPAIKLALPWLLLGCAEAPAPAPAHGGAGLRETSPTPRASAVNPAERAPLGGHCNDDDDCRPAAEQCLTVACQAQRCVAEPAPPRTVCELSDAVAARQAKVNSAQAGDPGVCASGACMPRVRCVEACGATGEAIAAPFLAGIERCYADKPDQAGHEECRAEAQSRLQSSRELFDWLKRCAYDCGYPEVAIPE